MHNMGSLDCRSAINTLSIHLSILGKEWLLQWRYGRAGSTGADTCTIQQPIATNITHMCIPSSIALFQASWFKAETPQALDEEARPFTGIDQQQHRCRQNPRSMNLD